jgi:hypothetical protein
MAVTETHRGNNSVMKAIPSWQAKRQLLIFRSSGVTSQKPSPDTTTRNSNLTYIVFSANIYHKYSIKCWNVSLLHISVAVAGQPYNINN